MSDGLENCGIHVLGRVKNRSWWSGSGMTEIERVGGVLLLTRTQSREWLAGHGTGSVEDHWKSRGQDENSRF